MSLGRDTGSMYGCAASNSWQNVGHKWGDWKTHMAQLQAELKAWLPRLWICHGYTTMDASTANSWVRSWLSASHWWGLGDSFVAEITTHCIAREKGNLGLIGCIARKSLLLLAEMVVVDDKSWNSFYFVPMFSCDLCPVTRPAAQTSWYAECALELLFVEEYLLRLLQ